VGYKEFIDTDALVSVTFLSYKKKMLEHFELEPGTWCLEFKDEGGVKVK